LPKGHITSKRFSAIKTINTNPAATDNQAKHQSLRISFGDSQKPFKSKAKEFGQKTKIEVTVEPVFKAHSHKNAVRQGDVEKDVYVHLDWKQRNTTKQGHIVRDVHVNGKQKKTVKQKDVVREVHLDDKRRIITNMRRKRRKGIQPVTDIVNSSCAINITEHTIAMK
jgi:hypothetical protein